MSELRLALVHTVRTLGHPVAAAAREFGVSRKTACKWLAVHAADPAAPLDDRSRRPACSPGRTDDAVERQILAVRDRRNWGPRKIHAHLRAAGAVPADALPTARTVARVLARHGRVGERPAAPAEVQRFERGAPNDLWQLDHQGRVEVARKKLFPLTVIDDHARYLLAYEPLADKTMATAWAVLWACFAEAGLPREVLTDNAFNTMGIDRPVGLSWFDARLVRLGIAPCHGRPYHPQTQGKVERLHGSAARELLYFDARRGDEAHFRADCARWRRDYNALRPHEALQDQVPASRWRPALDRPRPADLPAAESYYPPGAELRRVCAEGLVRVDGCRVLVGRGIATQAVRVERLGHEVVVYYCWKAVRRLSHEQLVKDKVL